MTFSRAELALYAVAALIYISLGLWHPEFILSWIEGAAFLLLAVWLIPRVVRRFRR